MLFSNFYDYDFLSTYISSYTTVFHEETFAETLSLIMNP